MATVEAAARENGAAIESLGPQGIAVFPADDEFTPLWRQLAGPRPVWTFALQGEADVRADASWLDDRWVLQLHTPAGAEKAVLRMAGQHNLKNALAATACALAAGVPLAHVVSGLEAFEPVKGRSRLHRLQRGAPGADAGGRQLQRQPGLGAGRHRRAGHAGRPALAGARRHGRGRRAGTGSSMPKSATYARQRGIEQFWSVGELCVHAAAAYGRGARQFGTRRVAAGGAGAMRRPWRRCWSRAPASCAWSGWCRPWSTGDARCCLA